MSSLYGTRRVMRLIVRRDRVLLPLWVILLSVIPLGLINSIKKAYPTAADLEGVYKGAAHSAAYIALYGPDSGPSLGALGFQRSGIFMVVIALVSMLTVIRHTRTEEEAGRKELLASTPLGRQASVTAALAVTILGNAVLAIFLMGGLSGSLKLDGGGAVAFGLAQGLAGCVFAAVGALTAQLFVSARAARGVGIGVLAVAYLFRMIGDSAGSGSGLTWMSWATPIGWLQHVRPFAGERWWLFLPALALLIVLVGASYALSKSRDLGAGLVEERPGPVDAAPSLSGPLALAWRMHRSLLLSWSVGFALVGAAFGGLAKSIQSAANVSENTKDILSRLGGHAALGDTYLAALTSIAGLVAAAYATQTVTRLRSEESDGRVELILVTPVSRTKWAMSHLTFTLLGPAIALICYGLTSGIAYGASIGDMGKLPRVLGGAVVQLPAVWVVAAITLALFGLLPRFAMAGWAVLVLCLFFGQFGEAFKLKQAVLDISPFTHIPRLPGGSVSATPIVVLVVVSAVVSVAGLAGLRRRDVPVG